jgi:hypothetical protein
MKTRAVVAAVTGACIALCAPTLAPAAVTIGGDIAAQGELTPCGGAQACEFAQVTLAGGQMSAPFDGVVVRWRVVGSSGPLALRVVRPAGPAYTFVSSSIPATPRSTGAETFPTRQPIRAGDYVGVELGPTAQVAMVRAAPAGDAAAARQFVPDGQTGCRSSSWPRPRSPTTPTSSPTPTTTASATRPRTSAQPTRAPRTAVLRHPQSPRQRRRRTRDLSPTGRLLTCHRRPTARGSRSAARSASSSPPTRTRRARPPARSAW